MQEISNSSRQAKFAFFILIPATAEFATCLPRETQSRPSIFNPSPPAESLNRPFSGHVGGSASSREAGHRRIQNSLYVAPAAPARFCIQDRRNESTARPQLSSTCAFAVHNPIAPWFKQATIRTA